jgi:hypothetical protein
MTGEGKYLIRAGITLALAVTVVVIESMWVTDNELIEQVVYDLARGVKNSNADAVLAHMAPHVQYKQGEHMLSDEATRELIRSNVSGVRFDFLRVSDLQTTSGSHTRRGTADFRVISSGGVNSSAGFIEAGTRVTAWSLGFQESKPGVWQVNRITPLTIPPGIVDRPPLGFPRTGRSAVGPTGSGPIQRLPSGRLPRGARSGMTGREVPNSSNH